MVNLTDCTWSKKKLMNLFKKNKLMPTNIYKGENTATETYFGLNRNLFNNPNIWSKLILLIKKILMIKKILKDF